MTAPRAILLDHAAGTPPDPELVAAWRGAMDALWAPTGGVHDASARARDALEGARADVAGLIGADPDDVVFTAGPTEARVTAVAGLLDANDALGAHAVASALEHPSVLWALRRRDASGGSFTAAPAEPDGTLTPAGVVDAMRDDTALVCVHHAQADVGTVQNVAGLVAAVRARRADVRVHVDAASAAGVLPVGVAQYGADAVSLGGPALGLPGFVGALWVRPGARMTPLVGGGEQQWGRRAGPEDVPAAVAMAWAARRAAGRDDRADLTRRAQRLWDGLAGLGDVRLNGPPIARRLPGNVHASFGGVTGETLAVALAAYGVAVSPGSACAALAGKASPVLEAMGEEPPWSLASVLFSLAPGGDDHDIDEALERIAACLGRLRLHRIPGA